MISVDAPQVSPVVNISPDEPGLRDTVILIN